LPPARPGAHIDLHLPGGMLRTYSLCGPPRDAARYVVAIKREAAGRGGSAYLCDTAREGENIGVSLPRGGVPITPGARNLFIAGGIGVTSFLSAAAFLFARGDRNFCLHVVARGGKPPLADMIAPLRDAGLAVVHDSTLARPDFSALIGPPDPCTRLACCGPVGMISAFEAAVADWPPEHIHIERFVPPPLAPDPKSARYTLVLARSGTSMDVPRGIGMLEAIAACGVAVPTSCGGGICGACRVDFLEGTPLHHDRFLSMAERARSLLACVAGCAGGRLVLDL
jgi:vanillate O-demethylase ferredoxin subunit